MIQRQREALTSCFDESLLTGPASEEGVCLFFGRQRAERSHLSGREKPFGDSIFCQLWPDSLDVHTDLPAKSQADQRQFMAVREVELKRCPAALHFWGKGRLAMGIVLKSDLLGLTPTVVTKN